MQMRLIVSPFFMECFMISCAGSIFGAAITPKKTRLYHENHGEIMELHTEIPWFKLKRRNMPDTRKPLRPN
jgi:hypothetical protein